MRSAAEVVWSAWREGRLLDALPEECRPRDEAEGHAAQAELAELAGERYGWKLAATSAAGQRHIGVTAPLPGRLFARFVHGDGETLSSQGMHMRVVEAELAFRLARDLAGPGPYSQGEVLDAVDALLLAIEVPDSRFERFELAGGPQLLADDACAGRFVAGPEAAGWRELDLAAQPVVLHVNGAEAGRGSGANVLGDPRAALTWLANELPRHGLALAAGDVVTTGVTTVPAPVGPGDRVVAEFPGLGSVSVSFA